MSYSFQVKAATKAKTKAAVEAEFEKVLVHQPIHARDKAAALGNANAVIDLLPEDDSNDISVSCNGYVSWYGSHGEDQMAVPLTGASVSCSAGFVNREQ
ncbi:conserved hypothetical protein [Cupriavidus necator]|uniref:Uncharacterized protein n=1 Tax=Cupriavidus necator TaxID=106590 RepID=A0A1K0J381_CUPNE|nr:conserved hypothetical protein [Cupriavidus necator]